MTQTLSYRTPGTRSAPVAGWVCAAAAVAVGFLSNLLASGLVVLNVWDVPRGTSIRPMALAGWMFLVSAGGAGAACLLTAAAVALSRWRKRIWLLALAGLLIALAALPVSWAVLDWIVTRHGVTLAD